VQEEVLQVSSLMERQKEPQKIKRILEKENLRG